MEIGGCDVGVRHLTFCFAKLPVTSECIKHNLEHIEITDMIHIDLLESEQNITLPKCSHSCSLPVRFWWNDNFYCSRHGKTSPETERWNYSPIRIKQVKKKQKGYCGICKTNLLNVQRYIAFPIIEGYRYMPCCNSCIKKNTEGEIWPYKKVYHTELQGPQLSETEEIFSSLVNILHTKFKDRTLDLMFIENQPTHMNPRMKSIQMILYGFFQSNIRTERGGRVCFVSPNQKWKANMPTISKQLGYKEHKKESINHFLQWAGTRETHKHWLEWIQLQKKKDDLCDAFWLMISGIQNWNVSDNFLQINQNQNQI